MTKYLDSEPFSTAAPPGQKYRDNWDAIFSKNLEDGVIRKDVAADVELNCPSDGKETTQPYEQVVSILAHKFMDLREAVENLRDSVSTRRMSKKEAALFGAFDELDWDLEYR